eukprot:scaffold432_cov345-Prasinococcus_capsulatus_cf.AAC.1
MSLTFRNLSALATELPPNFITTVRPTGWLLLLATLCTFSDLGGDIEAHAMTRRRWPPWRAKRSPVGRSASGAAGPKARRADWGSGAGGPRRRRWSRHEAGRGLPWRARPKQSWAAIVEVVRLSDGAAVAATEGPAWRVQHGSAGSNGGLEAARKSEPRRAGLPRPLY